MARYSMVPRSLMHSLADSAASPEARLMLPYAWTCHESHMSGIFQFSLRAHARVLGANESQIEGWISELVTARVVQFDAEWSVIWVLGMRDHNAKGGSCEKGVRDHLETLPPSFVVRDYIREMETPGVISGTPSGRVQETLFHQDQDQDQNTGCRERARLVRQLWDLHEQLRARIGREIGAKARRMKLTPDRKKRIGARLDADGYDAVEHVIRIYASEAGRTRTLKWLNGVTPFRPDNFTRALGRIESDMAQGSAEAAPAEGVEAGERFSAHAAAMMGETH